MHLSKDKKFTGDKQKTQSNVTFCFIILFVSHLLILNYKIFSQDRLILLKVFFKWVGWYLFIFIFVWLKIKADEISFIILIVDKMNIEESWQRFQTTGLSDLSFEENYNIF